MEKIRFWVNDELHEVAGLSTNLTVLNYLRYHAGLTGTKEGCAEGDCGACSVVLLEKEEAEGTYRAVNSCLLFLPAIHGRRVFTVEGLAREGELHPVQDAMVRNLGSQCGYCTPGFIMALFEACYREDMDGPWQLDDQLCGNLCRCTGYRPIRTAGKEIAGLMPDDHFQQALKAESFETQSLTYAGEEKYFWRPDSFDALFQLLAQEPDAKIIAGATDLALEVTKFHRPLPKLISVEGLQELKALSCDESGWHIGAGVTLSRLEMAVANRLPALENMLRYFASRQIKNRATVGGNIANASPIGDLAPVFLALDARLLLRSAVGTRQVACDDFFLDYRKTALQPGEILDSVFVPHRSYYANAYKVSKRKEMDISAIAAGLALSRNADGKVTEARFGFGGVAATPKRASGAEQAIVGRKLTAGNIRKALAALETDFAPLSDHRGSTWYRQKVAKNFLFGFFEEAMKSEFAKTIRPGALAHPEVRP